MFTIYGQRPEPLKSMKKDDKMGQ